MEWDFVVDGVELKGRHEKLISELSLAYDALYGLKEKMMLLPDVWKGQAMNTFADAFTAKWEESEQCLKEMNGLFETLVKAEKALRDCEEKQISQMIQERSPVNE